MKQLSVSVRMFVLVVPLVPSPFTMTISAVPGDVVAGIVAFLHVYFMCLETFMWRGRARKVFGTPRAIADITANLAANQVSARCPVRHPLCSVRGNGGGCPRSGAPPAHVGACGWSF